MKYIKNKIPNANGKILEILMQILWKEFAFIAEGFHKIKLEFLEFCNVAENFYFYIYFIVNHNFALHTIILSLPDKSFLQYIFSYCVLNKSVTLFLWL